MFSLADFINIMFKNSVKSSKSSSSSHDFWDSFYVEEMFKSTFFHYVLSDQVTVK